MPESVELIDAESDLNTLPTQHTHNVGLTFKKYIERKIQIFPLLKNREVVIMELQFLLDNNLLELNKVSLLGGCVLWLTIVATISHFVSMEPHYPLYYFLPSPVKQWGGGR